MTDGSLRVTENTKKVHTSKISLYVKSMLIPVAVRSKAFGLRILACWYCGVSNPTRGGHEYLSIVNIVCCLVDVSATGRSLVQRIPTKFGVSKCEFKNLHSDVTHTSVCLSRHKEEQIQINSLN
jgi:hypothetical protein